jgi:hypothetical protein
VPSWLVGTWKCDTKLQGTSIQVSTSFGSDGTYTHRRRHTDKSGQFTAWSEVQGSFQVAPRGFVFTPSSGANKYVRDFRKYVREGRYLWLEFVEYGRYQLPFFKVEADDGSQKAATPAAAVESTRVASYPPQQIVVPGPPQQGVGPGEPAQRGGALGRILHGGGRRRL